MPSEICQDIPIKHVIREKGNKTSGLVRPLMDPSVPPPPPSKKLKKEMLFGRGDRASFLDMADHHRQQSWAERVKMLEKQNHHLHAVIDELQLHLSPGVAMAVFKSVMKREQALQDSQTLGRARMGYQQAMQLSQMQSLSANPLHPEKLIALQTQNQSTRSALEESRDEPEHKDQKSSKETDSNINNDKTVNAKEATNDRDGKPSEKKGSKEGQENKKIRDEEEKEEETPSSSKNVSIPSDQNDISSFVVPRNPPLDSAISSLSHAPMWAMATQPGAAPQLVPWRVLPLADMPTTLTPPSLSGLHAASYLAGQEQQARVLAAAAHAQQQQELLASSSWLRHHHHAQSLRSLLPP